ncbi:hypothetical protein KM1_046270, partial [Entamoeba histolytica HM-3:IMSS]
MLMDILIIKHLLVSLLKLVVN